MLIPSHQLLQWRANLVQKALAIAEAFGGDGWDGELLPAGALLTGSEEYYPIVAINALMRSLRDAALSSQHFEVRNKLPQSHANTKYFKHS